MHGPCSPAGQPYMRVGRMSFGWPSCSMYQKSEARYILIKVDPCACFFFFTVLSVQGKKALAYRKLRPSVSKGASELSLSLIDDQAVE